MRLPFQSVLLLTGAFALVIGASTAYGQEEDDAIEETEVAEAEAAEEEVAEDDEDVETVIVTGSHIRRETFDLPSPVDTIDELDLQFAGTPDLGDIIFDQTYQVGVNANAAPFEFGSGDDQGGPAGVEVFPNLRGLGARATMTMMDGHRVPTLVTGYSFWTRRAGADVTNLYPGIGIGRVETVLDGASAIYGSEAVSGVVNLIPRKNFDGLDVSYSLQQALDEGAPSKSLGILAGAQGDRTSAIFAIEIRDVESMPATARPRFIVSSTGWTGQLLPTYGERGASLPGEWRVPRRYPTGELEQPPLSGWQNFANPADAPPGFIASSGPWHLYPAVQGESDYYYEGTAHPFPSARADGISRLRTLRRYDPGCHYPFGGGHDSLGDPSTANEFGLGYNDVAKKGSFLNGYTTGNNRGIETRTIGDEATSHGSMEDCRQVTADWQDIRAHEDRQSGMGFFEHSFNDYVSIHGELVVSSMEYNTRDRAYQIDEWNEGTSFYGPDVAIAIGSNPGNPFRAFADGSNSCDYMPDLPGCDTFSPLYERPDLPGVFKADTFMSYHDANGNGVYDYLEEAGELLIYAQDRNGDGLPDRDLNGDGVADDRELADISAQKDPYYRVVLLPLDSDSDGDGIPDRFDIDSHGTIGLRLFEDVRMTNLAPHPKQPYVHESYPWLNPDMSFDRRNAINNLRLRFGTSINIPDTEWIFDADWIWARGTRENDYLEPVWNWVVASLRCKGGSPQGSASPNECWNPFSTAWLDSDPETGEILPAWRDKDDPAWNTELETRRAGLIMRQDSRVTGTQIIDLVASNGSLFDLWYNDAPVGVAAGVHYRVETENQRPNQYGNSTLGSARQTEQQTEETTTAVFGEVQLFPIDHPRWGEMEVQLAVRYAEFVGRASFAEAGQESRFEVTIPKIAMRYQPFDWLAFRGSVTEGFVLPGMFQLFNSADYRNEFGQVRDYLCDLAAELPHCAEANPNSGVVNNVLVVSNAPNEGLGAEVSDLWNAGVSMKLLDGDMLLDLDYTTVDFNGRVERISPAGVVGEAGANFEGFIRERCGQETLLNYDDENRFPPEQYPSPHPRNAVDYAAQTSAEELQCRQAAAAAYLSEMEVATHGHLIERDAEGRLVSVRDSWVNQGEQTATTLIFNGTYNFDGSEIPLIGGDYGGFSVNVSATKMLELSLERWAAGGRQQNAGIRVDGVGNRNQARFGGGNGLFTPLPATPEYRVNAGLRWFRGNHSAQLQVRWHSALTDVNAAWDELLAKTADCRARHGTPTQVFDGDGNPTGWRLEGGEALTDPFCTNGAVRSLDSYGDYADPNGPLANDLNGLQTITYALIDPDLPIGGGEGQRWHEDNIQRDANGKRIIESMWTEADACEDQDRNPYCKIDSRHYWDLNYNYNRPDVFGLGYVNFNLGVRNIFGTEPDPFPSGVGYESYVDDIMGRLAYTSLRIGF